eukprot:m.8972 g.8972  ORF g.8972 m.8972 type:complete len:52 (+) comp9331_c0_seq4:210-365(+)
MDSLVPEGFMADEQSDDGKPKPKRPPTKVSKPLASAVDVQMGAIGWTMADI